MINFFASTFFKGLHLTLVVAIFFAWGSPSYAGKKRPVETGDSLSRKVAKPTSSPEFLDIEDDAIRNILTHCAHPNELSQFLSIRRVCHRLKDLVFDVIQTSKARILPPYHIGIPNDLTRLTFLLKNNLIRSLSMGDVFTDKGEEQREKNFCEIMQMVRHTVLEEFSCKLLPTDKEADTLVQHLDIPGGTHPLPSSIILPPHYLSLKVLNVNGCILGEKKAVHLAETFLMWSPTLQEFLATHNSFGNAGAAAVAEVLKVNHVLRVLKLSDNDIGDMNPLAEALKVNSTLKVLGLKKNRIEDAGGIAIAAALELNRGLQTLELGGNESLNTNLFETALKVNSTLRVFNLRKTRLGDANAFASAVKVNSTLRTLHLGAIGIDGVQAALLIENVALTELDLSHNGMGVSMWYGPFTAALAKNTNLQRLRLKRNALRDEEAIKLAKALESNNSLRVLDVRWNKIGDVGAAAFARALMLNTSLWELNLRDNKIRDSGTIKIADSLRTNTTLRELNLNDNDFGDGGAERLAECLQRTTSLTSLNIGRSWVTFEGLKRLAPLFNTTGLKVIRVDDNRIIEADNIKVIEEAYKGKVKEISNYMDPREGRVEAEDEVEEEEWENMEQVE